MATRSLIAMKDDGLYKAIYSHFDGYPEHHMPILSEYYTDKRKVSRLIGLGDISILAPKIGRKKDFQKRSLSKNPEKTVLAYHRDRGEPWSITKPKIFWTFEQLMEEAPKFGAEYVYVFDKGEWRGYDV